ncbi:RNA polymerase sigma factor [Leptospira kmetyi]|uniref:Sigma-70 family RNA polymerase sigma factor n=1 Tax=Leptospira kmetyi TaxID=408139 RepID=A0A2M9XQE4_9LEPT|nr:sigma-70 family RNA polymerase sigma factor [Leptospira kmetyi]AYV55704.1 sigma-70 family RNA polymerase sigma factor [Leptospira kmetyi]PJZ30190.1 sigma-70 family RNA polymerase sigma factor [Leptospira kmetyi]PJZ41515.1 sigma-70 family RNA polymerase sigma factor [Leptospira kmetyi]TGK16492.1 sigma-70 family RNA polymerase sigma factor [Leptospira kmetyi]TGK34105.1 sigma-70 family RNA polymerase sigma factor [Leptospira kmetyi]
MKDKSYIELLENAKAGDLKSWTELQNRFSRFAYQHAVKILKDEDLSEDVVQESFWDLYRNLNAIKVLEAFPILLKRAVIKHGDRILRKKENQSLVFADLQQFEQNAGETHLTYFEKERSEAILKNVNRLSPEDRKLIELYYYKNFTLDEISKSQGKTLSFIKKRHLKLKDILRDGIGEIYRPEACLRFLSVAA